MKKKFCMMLLSLVFSSTLFGVANVANAGYWDDGYYYGYSNCNSCYSYSNCNSCYYTYPTCCTSYVKCKWIPGHYNRCGYWVPGTRVCYR